MSVFALDHADLATASATASDAAASAKDADSAEAYDALASGLPGTTTAEVMPQLGDAMADGIAGWSSQVSDFGDSLSATSSDARATDDGAGGIFDFLRSVTGEAG